MSAQSYARIQRLDPETGEPLGDLEVISLAVGSGELTFALTEPEPVECSAVFDLPPVTFRFTVPPSSEHKPICAAEGHVFWHVDNRRWCGRCGFTCDW